MYLTIAFLSRTSPGESRARPNYGRRRRRRAAGRPTARHRRWPDGEDQPVREGAGASARSPRSQIPRNGPDVHPLDCSTPATCDADAPRPLATVVSESRSQLL